MTLHAAKGLEFPVAFIVGLEQGLLPHSRANESDDELEEERRLLFVGITRAERELYLSHCRIREFRGQRQATIPSCFLAELPEEALIVRDLTGGETPPLESVPRPTSNRMAEADGEAFGIPPDDRCRLARGQGRSRPHSPPTTLSGRSSPAFRSCIPNTV